MPLQISRDRYRPADRIYFSGGGHAGIPEPEGIWRVRQRQQAGRLERVADIRTIAGAALLPVLAASDVDQDASRLKQFHFWGEAGGRCPLCAKSRHRNKPRNEPRL